MFQQAALSRESFSKSSGHPIPLKTQLCLSMRWRMTEKKHEKGKKLRSRSARLILYYYSRYLNWAHHRTWIFTRQKSPFLFFFLVFFFLNGLDREKCQKIRWNREMEQVNIFIPWWYTRVHEVNSKQILKTKHWRVR